MSVILDLSFRKAFAGFLFEILGHTNIYKVFENKTGDDISHHNLLNSCLFVFINLDNFIKNVEDKGYNINCGAQKLRGQIGCLSSQLNCIDYYFRKALYNHNLQHGNIYRLIPKDRFSFNNIHMNLGNVRWFSTSVTRFLKTQDTIEKKDRQHLFQNNYNIIS